MTAVDSSQNASARPAPRPTNMARALNRALADALDADHRVVLLGEDVADPQGGGVYTVTRGLSTKFGEERVRSTPISEQGIMGAAVGLALAGMLPVAEIMLMNFMTVAMDQFTNHAAKLRYMSGGRTPVPLTVRCSTGAGMQFGAQHSDFLEAWFTHTPGCKVVIPSNPADAYGLLHSCIFDEDPCLVIEHSLLYGTKGTEPDPDVPVPLGKANIVRAGSDATLVSYGRTLHLGLAAAQALQADGLSIEVIDLRTIAPWDEEAVLESVARTRRAVVAHEAVKSFGVGAEIASRVHEELHSELFGPVARIGAQPTPVPYARSLEQAFLPTQADIEGAIRSLVGLEPVK